ncbi:hypothetical protein AH6C_024 [Aeromonas phage pAh6-C]|uniref:Uncharacterized protein n=1 Tax=Aeromonas phage pAh6-C TaxID=1505227 RepID=A0A076G4H4_9CAUD|nr:tail fiber protein [Aeromonas phage pAh6-C]AII26778.1 hypothetical protein AH6C_024 [Aeromonas phage pAh6-C]
MKYSTGWIGEIPTFEVLNFQMNRIDTALLAFAERGAPEWGPDIEYVLGAQAFASDGKIYVSKVAAPSRVLSPQNNLTEWEESSAQFTMAQHAAMVAKFDAHIARMDNPHGVTAAQAGTYTKAQINDKIAVVDQKIASHTSDMGNPHGTTASQIGAVPITGGTYTGPVVFANAETKINPGAGDHAVFADATAVGLRYNTIKIGIEKSSGRAFMQNGASKQYLLNEPEYVELRKTVEKNYAVPTPDLELDLLSDIHIKQGFGFSEMIRELSLSYTDKSGILQTAPAGCPRHERKGLLLDASVQEYLNIDAQNNFAGFVDSTMLIEGIIDPVSTDSVVLQTDTSGRDDRVYVSPAGLAYFRVVDSGGQPRDFLIGSVPKGVLFKIVVVLTATRYETYLNGVPGAAGYVSFVPSDSYNIVRVGTIASSFAAWWCRKFSVWARALTPEQITTL